MITKFKLFENRLRDVPMYSNNVYSYKNSEDEFKYKIDDIVLFEELNRHYIIKKLNYMSKYQDYYLTNPLDNYDNGWVLEVELKDPDINSKNYNDVITKIQSEKYNL